MLKNLHTAKTTSVDVVSLATPRSAGVASTLGVPRHTFGLAPWQNGVYRRDTPINLRGFLCKAAWLLPALFFSMPAWAQEATEAACVEGECCPPNTSQQIFIGVGTLFTGIVALFLLPRIIERAAINKGRSPLSARHTGISLAILLANLGLVGMTYAVTNCFPAKLLIWVGVVGALWLIHGVYALVATRN